MAAEGHCRFGSVAGKRKEPFSGSASEQNTQSVFHVRMSLPCRVVFPELSQRESDMPLSGTACFREGSFKPASERRRIPHGDNTCSLPVLRRVDRTINRTKSGLKVNRICRGRRQRNTNRQQTPA